MYELTGFQRDLLLVLYGMDAPSGRDIQEELESSQDISIHQARLYTNLDALVEEGFVRKGRSDGRTNRYSLTLDGEREVVARHEWQLE